MQTQLSPEYADTPDGLAGQALLAKCVHCGFCTATCPTYQLLGDELDGPRGRIYQIKEVLEGSAPTRETQLHLDRCLTCRNCETTCPSGVEYGQLIDLGRKLVDAKVPRSKLDSAVRWGLKTGLSSPLFAPAMALGQLVRPLLPASIKAKVPAKQDAGTIPTALHPRKMLMLAGCVQPAMSPNINSATQRVLNAVGIQTLVPSNAGCCGAVKFHLNDQAGGLAQMRANIDAWWPLIAAGAERIVMNASGCGVTVKEYGHHLANDRAYAEKAARVSSLCVDASELLEDMLPQLQTLLSERAQQGIAALGKTAFHPPCTLQHGQQLRGKVETGLRALGFDIELASCEPHLCCGSAGTYSVTQPVLSKQLRDRKLKNLQEAQPGQIVSANIGCITHLQSGTDTPVMHWIELLDKALALDA